VVEIKIVLLRSVTLYFGYTTVGEQPSKDETKYMKQGAETQKENENPCPTSIFPWANQPVTFDN
jgi:hypothetical protein